MTGTAHRAPEPQPTTTALDTPTTPALDTPTTPAGRRRNARAAALAATIAWYDTIHADLTALLDAAGIHGDRRAIAFTVGVDASDDDHHWREALRSAQLVGFANETTLTPAGTGRDAHLWPEAVDLWLELTDFLSILNGDQVSPGLLIDLDTRTIGSWYPYYCPDEGNHPEAAQIIPTLTELAADEDPYADLLTDDPDDEENEAVDNLLDILDVHDLEPPSTPAHETGDCDTDD